MWEYQDRLWFQLNLTFCLRSNFNTWFMVDFYLTWIFFWMKYNMFKIHDPIIHIGESHPEIFDYFHFISTIYLYWNTDSIVVATVSADLQIFSKVFPKLDTLDGRFIIVAKRAQRGQNPRPYRTYWGKSPLRGGVLGVHCLSLK